MTDQSEAPKRARPGLLLQRLTQSVRNPRLGTPQPRPGRLSWERREALFRQEPILKRAILKHSGDLMKQGFTVTVPGETEPHRLDDLVQAFVKDTFLDSRVTDAVVSSHIHGDGLIEIEWSDGGASDAPVTANAFPVQCHVIDPVGTEFHAFRDDDGSIRYFLVQRTQGGDPVTLHPDRYHHFRLSKLPGHIHGLSTVETAYHTGMAKVKADQAMGEIMWNSGNPKILATVQDGTDDEVDAITRMVNSDEFVRAYVWNERLEVSPINVTSTNPEPYLDWLTKSIAAAVGVPIALAIGIQTGAVTGSDTNLEDYHADLAQVQVNVLEPFITRIITGVTGLTPAEFDVLWTEFRGTKKVQSELLREQVNAWVLLSNNGVEPLAAARIVGLALSDVDLLEALPGFTPPITPATPVPAQTEEDVMEVDEDANPA